MVVSSDTEYGERYEEKELLGEGGFGKVISSCNEDNEDNYQPCPISPFKLKCNLFSCDASLKPRCIELSVERAGVHLRQSI